MRKLTDAFMEMVERRLEDISTEMVVSDPIYKTASSELLEAQRELINTFIRNPLKNFIGMMTLVQPKDAIHLT